MQQLDTCLASLKFVRQLVIGLRRGQLPSRTSTAVPEILARMEQELGPSLAEEGIRFLIEVKPGVRPVNAEPFLLRGALGSLVDDSRRRLTGLSDGVIRIFTQPDTNGVRVSVFDNLIAVSTKHSSPSRYLQWPLERRLSDVTTEVVRSIVEYFQGQWAVETRESIGTVRAIILPTA